MGSICSCCKTNNMDTSQLIQGKYCFQCGKTFKNKKEYDSHKSECYKYRIYGGL